MPFLETALALITPLHPIHVQLNAKFVDFAGWNMPVYYRSQLAEHAAVRTHAGIFDVSHMRALDVTGPNAQSFLRRALANDVAKLQPGRALYTCLLNESGGVEDDLIAYFMAPGRYRLVVNAATAIKDLRFLQGVAEGYSQVDLSLQDTLCIVAVQGPNSKASLVKASPEISSTVDALKSFQVALAPEGWTIARTGYTGEDGYELILPPASALHLWGELVRVGVVPCGLGARDSLRLEAGLNLYGQDMDPDITPYECGLGWTVDGKDPERQFMGKKQLLARRARFHLVGLITRQKAMLRAQQIVMTESGSGVVTSGGYSPMLSSSVAMARVPVTVRPGEAVSVTAGTRVIPAVVTPLPFVRNGAIHPAAVPYLA